jgi:glyoxylase-like metal-dependent hydrolase (beta-lactamase superfamily II)
MRKRIFLFLIISLCTGCAENHKNEYSATNFDLIKISDGVYACIHKFGGKAICNSGIVDNGESTIVFDTFLSPDAAEELIESVKHLKLSPVKYVINSHYHNDHIRGNQSFSPEVRIMSTRKTAELIEQEEPKEIAAEKIYAKKQYEYFDSLSRAYKGDTALKEYQEIKMMKPYFEELSKSHEIVKTRLPDTYIENEKSLDGSRRKVILIDKGKGHSESDLIMYLPDEGILFAGDLVFNKSHPYLGDGYPLEWESKLKEMEAMKIEVVIPGHGDPGGKEIIRSIREYIEDIEEIAKEMKDKGNSIEAIKNIQVPEKYKDWWLENYFHSNLEFMFDKI